MEKIKHTTEEAQEIQEALTVKGFDVELSADYEYFKLMFHGQPICEDSANTDLYNVESAEAEFNYILSKISQPARWVGIVKAAIDTAIYDNEGNIRTFNINSDDLDQILIEAEAFVIDSVPFEERTIDFVPEFWENQKCLTYCDEDNQICVQAWGEIISDDWKCRSYYRIHNKKIVEKLSCYLSDEEDVYCYLDVVVTTRGEVINLFA
jgi:hypothetical protein